MSRYAPEQGRIDPRSTHGRLIDLVERGARVLDVGCSSGYLAAELMARGCSVVGVDVDAQAVEQACQRGVHAVRADIEVEAGLEQIPPGPYDALLLGDVLEHTRDPSRVLARLVGLLAPAGEVVASVPNIAYAGIRLDLLAGNFEYSDVGILDRTHTKFFNLHSLVHLIEECGLCVEHFETIDQPVDAQTVAYVAAHLRLEPSSEVWRVLDEPLGKAFQFVFRAHQDEDGACPGRLLLSDLRERYSSHTAEVRKSSAPLVAALEEAQTRNRQLADWASTLLAELSDVREEHARLEQWARELDFQAQSATDQLQAVQAQSTRIQQDLERKIAELRLEPLVSVIVLAFNGRKFLPECLGSVVEQDYSRFEVLVVDNGSTDGSAELVAQRFPQARVIRNRRNLGYAGGNNVGIRDAKGEVFFLVNQDVVLDRHCLSALMKSLAADPLAGIAGCKIYDADGRTLQHAGGVLSPNALSAHLGRGEIDVGQYDRTEEREYVTGAAIAIKRTVLNACGLLDPKYFPAYFEEADLCVTARSRGLRVLYVPEATLIHHEAGSTGKASQAYLSAYHRNRLRFLFKTFPPRRIWSESMLCEVRWITRSMPPSHVIPLARAYISTLLCLPELVLMRIGQRIGRTSW